MEDALFEIVDGKRRKSKPCGHLLFSPDRGFRIEISDDATTEKVPALFVPFIERGEKVIDDEWARRWVQDRICPPGRQNLGEVLTAHGLNEYDEIVLLRSSCAKSSQDDFIVREIRQDASGGRVDALKEQRKNLGAAIRNRREALGFSQSDLARRVGINQPALSRIEAGRTNVTFDLLVEIVHHLDLGGISVPVAIERFLWNGERRKIFEAIRLASGALAFAYARAIDELERYSMERMTAFIDSRVIMGCFWGLHSEFLDRSDMGASLADMIELQGRSQDAPPSSTELIGMLEALERGILVAFGPVLKFEERLNAIIARANRTDAKGNFESPLERDITDMVALAKEPMIERVLLHLVRNPLWIDRLEALKD